ncbi:hypothetical protein PsorP6_011995 [Peronosclerospora sorghi]|uniref:Uncharacterized protein n=1 Tax=Peronosclerospora sorghi TaxID=230839 RepID=A0ACC0WL19_9STRA|nr:hypothetical protein PsorP6_011995 [Peronosclerospora sorghi]
MSRSTPVARSRNGRAGADGPVASESETLVLRVTPSIRRYNIARFDLPELPHFSSFAQPFMMYREPERLDDEEEKEEDVSVGYNSALQKRRRRFEKILARLAGECNNKFNGTFEGGQSSTYMILVKNRHNDEFSVIPAEEINNEKKRAVERWLMKHKLAGEDKADASGETVSAPRVCTGALAISSSKTKTYRTMMTSLASLRRRVHDVCHVRNEDDSRAKEDTPQKMAKISAATSSNKLTEAGVQQELIRYGGRMRTRDLLRNLRSSLSHTMIRRCLRIFCGPFAM